MSAPEPLDPAAADLHQLLTLGMERGGHLLSAGEAVMVRRILALPRDPARVYALLSARTADCWPEAALRIEGVEDLGAALDILRAAELIDGLVPWPRRAERLPRVALAQGAKRLGLSHTGSRAALVERLRPHQGWAPGRWVRVRHRGLVRRLERWALLRKAPDRATLVVERLGHVRWPAYAVGRGPTLHPHRRALLGWEALWSDPMAPGWTAALWEQVEAGYHRAPGRLDLGRTLQQRVLHQGRELERAGALAEARALYERAERALGAEVRVRIARTLEREGRLNEALQHLVRARDELRDPAIERAGRRVARALRRAWAPSPPLRSPPIRALRLPPAPGAGPRPLYRAGSEALPIEPATLSHLNALGRQALHAEGALWSTLAALLLAECYFLPVPGALPVRYLSGPLDLGTPAFRARREAAIDEVLQGLRRGEGPARIAAADAKWRGIRLSGAHFEAATGAQLVQIAHGLGPSALADLVERFADEGPRAAAGLPDLIVLPGPPVQLPGALPSRLPSSLLWAELKGPGDTLRDAQALWIDRLLSLGAPVELWEVRPAPPDLPLAPMSRFQPPVPTPTATRPLPMPISSDGTQLALLPGHPPVPPPEEDTPCPGT